MVDTKKRTFEVESSDINVKGGTYKSMTPDAAARKAGSRLFKKAESTSKSSKKEIEAVATAGVLGEKFNE